MLQNKAQKELRRRLNTEKKTEITRYFFFFLGCNLNHVLSVTPIDRNTLFFFFFGYSTSTKVGRYISLSLGTRINNLEKKRKRKEVPLQLLPQ
jgi:hypothetical protein